MSPPLNIQTLTLLELQNELLRLGMDQDRLYLVGLVPHEDFVKMKTINELLIYIIQNAPSR